MSRARRFETRGHATSPSAPWWSPTNINFALKAGARHAIIGPNGAGKTTFVNLITGKLRPDSGQVLLGGRRHHLARAGRNG